MPIVAKLKALFSKSEPVIERLPPHHEAVPCYVCETSVPPPGDHHCVAVSQPLDLFSLYLATRKSLKSLVLAIENDTLTQDMVDEAKTTLRLT